jgi:YVTN family beta-propeller protein
LVERTRKMQSRNHHRVLSLVLALAPAAFSTSASEVRIYVTDSGDDRIEVIDPTINKVVQVIGGIAVPHGIGFSPDSSEIYVSSESKNVLYVLDRASGKIIDKLQLSGHPNNIAVTKDGGRVLVAIREGEGALEVVDAATRSIKKGIPVHGPLHNVYVTPDDKYAVTGSIEGRMLTVIELSTERLAWEVPFEAGVRPMAIEANPDGSARRIFVELSNLHGFVVVDFAAHKEVARIILPDLPFKAEGDSSAEGTPCHGIAVAPDGKSVWINSIVDNAVFAYSLPGLRPLGHSSLPVREQSGQPPIGARPYWVTFTPDSQRVFVSNAAIDSVSVIDATAMKPVAEVSVGNVPKRSDTRTPR